MSHHHFLNRPVLRLLPKNLDNKIILDVACGFGDWGFLIRTRKSGKPYLISIDIWRPLLERLCAVKVYDGLLNTKLPSIPLKDKCVDISLACEILEHLQKDDGSSLLDELERVTRELIIVSTPLNMPQGKVHGIKYGKHISEWKPKELRELGYNVKVIKLLPKTLYLVDKVRRAAFGLPPPPKLILGIKRLANLSRMPRSS